MLHDCILRRMLYESPSLRATYMYVDINLTITSTFISVTLFIGLTCKQVESNKLLLKNVLHCFNGLMFMNIILNKYFSCMRILLMTTFLTAI